MKHKLGICIPYRDRKEHLDKLIPHLSKKLTEKNIDHSFYVGHQIDEKLFNRGAMKNIAAHKAFEDGCDYIAWHDVDMLTNDSNNLPGGDYSYPKKNPIHIATKLSKYNYGLGYDQYFGGVVLFTKNQAYQTNGYSNNYWDWGQEDDDLFWRCYYEGMTTGRNFKTYNNKKIYHFNGINSFCSIPTNREISSTLKNDHTISILFNAEQQEEKVPIWLVGDQNRKFIEYPLLRKEGSFTWGLSFNNSRAVTMQYFDRYNNPMYNWAKRFERLWTLVTLSFSKEQMKFNFYINDELISQIDGVKQNKPFPVINDLKNHDAIRPFLIGRCPHFNTFFKGKIADFKLYNSFFDNIDNVIDNNDTILDLSSKNVIFNNVDINEENIDVIENILPYRKEGAFYCLPHKDEGFVDGTWAKGETTARNEKRFVTEMQQGKIKYDEDGLAQILNVLKIIDIDEKQYPNTKILNVEMI